MRMREEDSGRDRNTETCGRMASWDVCSVLPSPCNNRAVSSPGDPGLHHTLITYTHYPGSQAVLSAHRLQTDEFHLQGGKVQQIQRPLIHRARGQNFLPHSFG